MFKVLTDKFNSFHELKMSSIAFTTLSHDLIEGQRCMSCTGNQ